MFICSEDAMIAQQEITALHTKTYTAAAQHVLGFCFAVALLRV
jgi:hypothetical protein